jgi:hypothetical protein
MEQILVGRAGGTTTSGCAGGGCRAKVLQGYAIEAAKIPLLRPVAGFAGDIGAVLTRQDISTNLQCGPSRPGRTGPTRGDR